MNSLNSSITSLINQAKSLPADQRALVVDALLRSLNPLQLDIESAWTQVAKQRLAEIQDNTVELQSAKQVFKEIDDLLD